MTAYRTIFVLLTSALVLGAVWVRLPVRPSRKVAGVVRFAAARARIGAALSERLPLIGIVRRFGPSASRLSGSSRSLSRGAGGRIRSGDDIGSLRGNVRGGLLSSKAGASAPGAREGQESDKSGTYVAAGRAACLTRPATAGLIRAPLR